MGADQKKKDILGDILAGGDQQPVSGVAELNELIYQVNRPQAQKPETEERRRPVRKKSSKKSTHYLSEEIFANLGETKEKIRDMLPDAEKTGISKSTIVNHALRLILKEFEQKGTQSLLVQQFIKKLHEK